MPLQFHRASACYYTCLQWIWQESEVNLATTPATLSADQARTTAVPGFRPLQLRCVAAKGEFFHLVVLASHPRLDIRGFIIQCCVAHHKAGEGVAGM